MLLSWFQKIPPKSRDILCFFPEFKKFHKTTEYHMLLSGFQKISPKINESPVLLSWFQKFPPKSLNILWFFPDSKKFLQNHRISCASFLVPKNSSKIAKYPGFLSCLKFFFKNQKLIYVRLNLKNTEFNSIASRMHTTRIPIVPSSGVSRLKISLSQKSKKCKKYKNQR